MKSKTSLSLSFAFLGTAVLIVCFNAWLAVHSVRALSESERWVSHTWHVLDSLDAITDSLTNAETATRGYLLAGEDAYLLPFNQAKANLPGEIDTAAALVVDNPPQQNALRELRAVIRSRMSLLEQSIEERTTGNPTSVHLLALNGTGLAAMEHARSLIQAMQATERRLLAQRIASWHRDGRYAEGTVVFASVVDLLLIFAMFHYVLMERSLRQLADESSDRLEKLQSISEVALTRTTMEELTVELFARVQSAISAQFVLLCIPDDGPFKVQAAVGAPIASGTVIPAAQDGPLERALGEGRVVHVPDTASAPLSLKLLRELSHSLLIAPLSGSRSVVGVLMAGRTTADAFDIHDEEMLRVAANRIALALDRANAYEAERQARKEAESRTEEVRSLNQELEQRVRQRTADLEAANRELEAFSYSVSHDLRAPLRTVDGFSLALQEDYAAAIDSTGHDYLRRIRDGVQRMGQLIDSLLQLSRITRAELFREPVDLSTLAATVAADLAAQSPQRAIAFQIEPGLKSMGDPRLLRAAFENLLENAIKFTARVPNAKIEFGQSGTEYFIRDNGAGFDMRYADKLFTAFNRLHGDKDFRGSGIGLATVARIVRRHRGNIRAQSEVGQGATFWFTLG